MRIRIATRSSKLALWQAEHVRARLTSEHRGLQVELVPITTKGDLVLDRPLYEVEGKGLFIKELEVAMSERRADIAVHCMKDFHNVVPDGFALPVVLPRNSSADVVLSRTPCASLQALPHAARVGTSSFRRIFQLKKLRPDLRFQPIRGNIDTRIERLAKGDFDAIVLAEAGLERLKIEYPHTLRLAPQTMMPAVGQGLLGIETRAGDAEVAEKIAFLHSPTDYVAALCERAFVRKLGADCKSAVGCLASTHSDRSVQLMGIVGDADTAESVSGELQGAYSDPEAVGYQLAEQLLAKGAAALMAKQP